MVNVKMNAKQLRNIPEEDCPQPMVRNPISIIVDGCHDTYSIGGLFRLADALAAEYLYICNGSPVPPNSQIRSSSSGTYKVVRWGYHDTTQGAIESYRKRCPTGMVFALEQAPDSRSFTKMYYPKPIALVVGNESKGIDERVLEEVDGIIEIPLWGINKSLNVIVAASLVGYEIMRQWNT